MRSLPRALLILALVTGCNQQTSRSPVGTLEVKAAVDSLWSGYAHASDRKDAKAFGALFAEDATLIESGASSVHGREAIQNHLVSTYAAIDPTGLRIEPDETRVSGSIAVQSGAYEEAFNDEKGVAKARYGRFVLIAEQEDDRTWKILRLVSLRDSTGTLP